MIKRLLIAIVLLAVLAAGVVGFNMFRDQAIENFFANMPVATVTVSTVEVKPESWTPSIDAIGTVNAIRGVDLTVETTGIVKELRFSANERVEAGAVLVQLDDAVQRADLFAARTQADLDKQALDRAIELQQRGVGSTVSLQAAEAAAAASGAQAEKLEAVLQQKQLRAPFAGTVGIPRVDIGQYLSPGTSVVTLQDLETMRADFTEPVGIDPKVDPSSRLVSVRAAIENPDERLTPGQFARIYVDMPREDDVIALPQTAVVTSLYGDYVYVARKPEAEGEGEAATEGDAEKLEARQVFVTVGRRSGSQVEIASGLEGGEMVVTAGQNRLNNGTPIAIDNTIDPVGQTDTQAASK
jgi:membrane fusion protein (multidrug efflux system)